MISETGTATTNREAGINEPLGRSSRSYMIGWSSTRLTRRRSYWIELGFDFVVDRPQDVSSILHRVREKGDRQSAENHPGLLTFHPL